MLVIKLEWTEEEYKELLLKSYKYDCPTIEEYLRYLLFDEDPHYLYEDIFFLIEVYLPYLESGTRFTIKDMYNKEKNWDDVPNEIKKNAEKMFYTLITNNKFVEGVVPDGKDADGVQWYKKL